MCVCVMAGFCFNFPRVGTDANGSSACTEDHAGD